MPQPAAHMSDQMRGKTKQVAGDAGGVEDAGRQDEQRHRDDGKAVETIHDALNRKVDADTGIQKVTDRHHDHRYGDRDADKNQHHPGDDENQEGHEGLQGCG